MTVPDIPGVPCESCGQNVAVTSIMDLNTWQQTKYCPQCFVLFCRAIVDQTGDQAAAQSAEPAASAEPATSVATAEPAVHPMPDGHVMPGLDYRGGDLVQTGPLPDGITLEQAAATLRDNGIPVGQVLPLEADKPDPMTTNVVKSTHGHRKSRTTPATTREDK